MCATSSSATNASSISAASRTRRLPSSASVAGSRPRPSARTSAAARPAPAGRFASSVEYALVICAVRTVRHPGVGVVRGGVRVVLAHQAQVRGPDVGPRRRRRSPRARREPPSRPRRHHGAPPLSASLRSRRSVPPRLRAIRGCARDRDDGHRRAARARPSSPAHVLTGDAIAEDYTHDEALTVAGRAAGVRGPAGEQRPRSPTVLRIANERGIPVTARGTGTGLSGACVPVADAIVVSFERMNRILEIDTENHVAVVEPGVTLDQLDEVTAAHDLIYPVFPGEYSASLGGNVATNAGGMRAVKYGVTRHQVLGLEAVLATGEIIRTGGKFVKATTGYDLTQLIIGSEGTLALVTEATLKLYPRLRAPGDGARAVPDARRDHRRDPADRRQRHRPADPRVHRHDDDVGDHRVRRPRPRHPAGDPGARRSRTSS